MVIADVLLILHFLSLAAGLVNMFGMIALALASASAPPGEAPVLRRMMPAFLRVGTWGLLGLWVTGIPFWGYAGTGKSRRSSTTRWPR